MLFLRACWPLLLVCFAQIAWSANEAVEVAKVAEVDTVAVIGNHAISTVDVVEHINALKLFYSVKTVNEKSWNDLANQAVYNLTDEIVLQEKASEIGAKISQDELFSYLDGIMQSNNMSREEFIKKIDAEHTTMEAVLSLIRVKALWRKILDLEIEPKVGIVSDQELRDFTKTVERDLITMSTIYSVRLITVSAADFTSDYRARAEEFIGKLRSCDNADKLAATLNIGSPSSVIDSSLGELSGNIQAGLLSLSPPSISFITNLIEDRMQIVMFCGVKSNKNAPNDLSREKAIELIKQNKRSQLTYIAMEKIRNRRFIDVKNFPEISMYRTMMASRSKAQ